MNASILLTVDLGTTNCKAAAFSVTGTCIASASAGYPTLSTGPGSYEQRASDWRAVVVATVRDVVGALGSTAADVAGLCVTAWGPGVILLDERGSVLNNSPTWQDVRSLEHGRRLLATAGSEWIGGGMPLTGFPAKLAWSLDRLPPAQTATCALGVKDYLLHWLTGAIVTEPSSGPYGAEWQLPVFDAIGWDHARLPSVVDPMAVAGRVTRERASELGLRVGLPVIAGVNDGAAATLGVGAHSPGDIVVSLGTNGVLRAVTTSPPSTESCLMRSLFRYPIVGSLWASGGFVLSGGSALAWLAAATGAPNQPTEIDDLLAEAATAKIGSEGVTFLPYLVGRGSPRPLADAAASFSGLRSGHGRAHLARSVLEGVAFGFREIADALDHVPTATRTQLLLTGGGAASPLWREVISAVLGMPAGYTAAEPNVGLAVVLAVGLGLQPDVASAVERFVPPATIVQPTADAIAAYADRYETYLKLAAGG